MIKAPISQATVPEVTRYFGYTPYFNGMNFHDFPTFFFGWKMWTGPSGCPEFCRRNPTATWIWRRPMMESANESGGIGGRKVKDPDMVTWCCFFFVPILSKMFQETWVCPKTSNGVSKYTYMANTSIKMYQDVDLQQIFVTKLQALFWGSGCRPPAFLLPPFLASTHLWMLTGKCQPVLSFSIASKKRKGSLDRDPARC